VRTQPGITVSGIVSGISPGAPEVAEMVTVFCAGMEAALIIEKAPPPLKQLPPI
jgi:hypothetical protein